jgi:hypothetical protein
VALSDDRAIAAGESVDRAAADRAAKLEAKLVGEMDVAFPLKDKLEPILVDYPHVVIDCPPTLV